MKKFCPASQPCALCDARGAHTDVNRFEYSSEPSWSAQPWRMVKCPSTLPSSALSVGGAGGRGPKSLFARSMPGRPEVPVELPWAAPAWSSRTTLLIDLLVAAVPGREDGAPLGAWIAGASRAMLFASAWTGACEANGLACGWPLRRGTSSEGLMVEARRRCPCRWMCYVCKASATLRNGRLYELFGVLD